MSVTWKLKPGVTWSDGQPFTAADCVFTWQFASNKETAAITYGNYSAVDKVEALDDHTVKVTFKQPTPAWYIPLTDAILPQHIFKDGIGAAAKNFAGNLKPIGTGPYVVDDFKPGDSIVFSANPKFRDPNGPAFSQVQWKGGGDAVSAARAVFQTGDFHVAANLQVEPAILDQIVKQSGGKAQLGFEPGHGVEQVLFNFTDPNKEVDGQRSHLGTPHPFLSDPQVRKAFNLLADRKTISDVLYGQSGEPWALLQSVPTSALPQGDTWAFNIEQAGAMLDAAGWTKQGQYRAKNGVPMKVLLVATTNSVRQKEQQILKDAFEKAGVQTELKSVDAGVYFSTDPGNDNTFQKFYSDMEMTTYPVGNPDPQSFLSFLTTAQIPQKENNWNGNNAWRYSSQQFDALNAQSKTELDPAKRDALFQQQYQLLYDDAVGIPLVARKEVFGYATGIENTFGQPWAGLTWNIANWTKK
jgi:peptide/nickel transport system substrate-binding protein